MVSNSQSRRFQLVIALSLLLVLVLLVGPASANGGRPLYATLSGANEVPPANPDGSGSASFFLNQGQKTICFSYTVENILLPATGAHIHRAPAGVNGPVVVHLSLPDANGNASGCATVSADLIKEIRQNPQDFYINVHNSQYPGGAVRGQLEKSAE